jgi:phosphoribosylpyrophosphate synthetase
MSELQYLNVHGDVCDVPLLSYPDTMPLVHKPEDIPNTFLLRPKSLASFVAAMFFFDALEERHDFVPDLILPFVPGARQDRLNSSGDYLFTAKSIARMLNERAFPSVKILDPHSEVIAGLIARCRVVHAADVINPPAGKYGAVISPDAGAEKRAGEVARKLGVPLIHAWKTRDVGTGAISGFGFDSMTTCSLVERGKRKNYLIVDDICDGGGTFVGLAQRSGAIRRDIDLHLFTTHGIYSKGVAPLAEHFSHIYCTDSIVGDRPGVIQIDVGLKTVEGRTMNPITLIDGYKFSHIAQYPKGTTRVYSNWTPRESRVPGVNKVTFFGLQYFLAKYLQEEFTSFFFADVDDVCADYQRRVNGYLGPNAVGTAHIRALHDLGYLPLEFRALPEGTAVPLRVPMFTVENTLPEFFWLVNYIESVMSASIWLPCTSATTAYRLRKLLDQKAAETSSVPGDGRLAGTRLQLPRYGEHRSVGIFRCRSLAVLHRHGLASGT